MAWRLPRVRDEGDVLRAVCVRLQFADRVYRAPLVWSRCLPRWGCLRYGARPQAVGRADGIGSADWRGCWRRAWVRDGKPGHPAQRHLLFDDYVGARADALLLFS